MKEEIKVMTFIECMKDGGPIGKLIQHEDKYYQYSTKNRDFIEIATLLLSQGVSNCRFMLTLYDKDLANVDPYDSDLSTYMKNKIQAECSRNIWYYMREVVKIPMQGGGFIPMKLTRTTLASSYCYENNINSYMTTPRQQYSTVTQVVLSSYEYLFGNASTIAIKDKSNDDSSLYVKRLKDIIDHLPKYIQNNKDVSDSTCSILVTGKTKKDIIAAMNNFNADIVFMNDFEFIQYPMTLYETMLPMYAPRNMNRTKQGLRSVININSPAGDMTLNEMVDIFHFIEQSCPWKDKYYDLNINTLKQNISRNTLNDMVYIAFSYRELGLTEEWFVNMSRMLMNNEKMIKRELLLERV